MSQEQTEAVVPVEDTLLKKPVAGIKEKKPRPPKSAAQLAAFAKALEVRHKMMCTKNMPAPQAQAVVEEEPKPKLKLKPVLKKVQFQPVSDDDEEAQIVIVKKKPKPKVVYQYESDDDEPVQPKAKPHKPAPEPHTRSQPHEPRTGAKQNPIAAPPKVNYAQFFY